MPARRSRLAAVLTLAATLVALPLGALASHDFADVPDSNIYHADISALAASGVTTGCGGGNFCPSAFVTREQMAAFMNRLGALAAGKTPVVNATKLDGLDSTDFMPSGDIVTTQLGPWLTTNDASMDITVDRTYEYEQLNAASNGLATFQLELAAPLAIGSATYGIKSVEVCWDASANVSITESGVEELIPGQVNRHLVNDGSTIGVSLSGCHTWTVATPTLIEGSIVFYLRLSFSSSGTLQVVGTTVTWTPTATLYS